MSAASRKAAAEARGERALEQALTALRLHVGTGVRRPAPLGVRSFLASLTDDELAGVLVALAALAPSNANDGAPSLRLMTAVRQDLDDVRQVLRRLPERDDRVQVALDLLAVIPADTDPAKALTWLNEPVTDWPDDLVYAEDARAQAGDRDAVALMAAVEAGRRRRHTLATSTARRTA